MGYNIKKWIPLWLKSPVAVFAQQFGRLPLRVVQCNMIRSYVQTSGRSETACKKALKETQDTIYRYLSRRYGETADRVLAEHTAGVREDRAPVWVFWWQGEEKAPYIIRTCVDHIRKNAGDHPVCIVDESNFRDYAVLPSHIMNKFQDGKISITHLSDYLRVNLLSRYGGLWIDGSIFVQQQIPEVVFAQPVWTIRNPGRDQENISGWNWTIGVMGGWKDNALFHAVAELLSCYWRDHDILADYFVMDYLMKLVYDRSPAVQEWIRSVQPNNDQLYYLQDHADQPVNPEDFAREMDSETWMYKISWKGQYSLRTSAGEQTVYGKWQQMYGLPTEAGENG